MFLTKCSFGGPLNIDKSIGSIEVFYADTGRCVGNVESETGSDIFSTGPRAGDGPAYANGMKVPEQGDSNRLLPDGIVECLIRARKIRLCKRNDTSVAQSSPANRCSS